VENFWSRSRAVLVPVLGEAVVEPPADGEREPEGENTSEKRNAKSRACRESVGDQDKRHEHLKDANATRDECEH